jgi:phosphomannomutase / phosphoglucomutase
VSASSPSCFKAYDIRGRVPTELNEAVAYRIGRVLVAELDARSMVVGRDVRLESPALAGALIRGITEGGADVIDIGLCGTEEVYFATNSMRTDGGVMVTASHNPKGYNGMKLVRAESRPISGDSGLQAIRERVERGDLGARTSRLGCVQEAADKSAYVEHLLSYVDIPSLYPLTILADAGNGSAGLVVDALAPHLPFRWVRVNFEPDGNFPHGVPNPLLPENRALTRSALLEHGSDIGLAWDGDFDRCFFFDSEARFIEGYYLVGLLSEMILKRHPGSKIIHDPRLIWNTRHQVMAAGGIPIQTKTGHAFIKERMRQEDAAYGGEMSAHHYFRDFAYCDSGMIPWLLVTALISTSSRSLASLVEAGMAAYPCSGEINFRAADVGSVLDRVRRYYAEHAACLDETDGLSFEFDQWRFNLRGSNTEPLLRLNVETRGDPEALERYVTQLRLLIRGEHE